MQLFLDAHPQYWRFIPMSVDEARVAEEHNVAPLVIPDPAGVNQRTREQCDYCLRAVPSPPTGFVFSKRQIVEQTQYFHLKRDRTLPSSDDLDLYQASIVAVCK
jgi:hypothetical protein